MQTQTNDRSSRKLEYVSAAELMNMAFPARRELVTGLFAPGLYILAGPSKVGKSWMVLDLANRVSLGQPFLGRETRQCEVLYISLEDTFARLQERLTLVAGERPGPVLFATQAELLGKGFEEQLGSYLMQNPKTGLVIVDTLQRIRQVSGDQYSYGADYEVMNRLKALADHHSATVLVVHHTRKMGANDAFDTISGTTGLMGSADGALVLRRDSRMDGAASLNVTGREVEDQELRLSFDKSTMTWGLLPETLQQNQARQSEQTRLCQALRTLVDQQGPFQGTATQLVQTVTAIDGRLDLKPQSISVRLGRLENTLQDTYHLELRFRRTTAGRQIELLPCRQSDDLDSLHNLDGPDNLDDPDNLDSLHSLDDPDSFDSSLPPPAAVKAVQVDTPEHEKALPKSEAETSGDWEDEERPDDRAYMGWEDERDYESYWDSLLLE